MTSSRITRSAMLAISAVAAAAIALPATASAGWSTIDENGNTTPAGHGSAPDPPQGGGSSSGGGYVATEVGSTVPNTSGSCRWTVKGRLLVRNPTVVELTDGESVEGDEVKVSGRSSLGAALGDLGYNSWGTVTTDANGEFSVSKTECGNCRVKVEAKFDSDDLRVLGPSSPTWYQLHDTLDEIAPRTSI
jgi:hypothetical protein